MRFGSYSLSQARKTFGSSKFEQDKHLEISCLQLFKTFIFSVKLQTSLYHPIPLDSKPYKQTNRLENLLLFLILFLFCFILFCMCFGLSIFCSFSYKHSIPYFSRFNTFYWLYLKSEWLEYNF